MVKGFPKSKHGKYCLLALFLSEDTFYGKTQITLISYLIADLGLILPGILRGDLTLVKW